MDGLIVGGLDGLEGDMEGARLGAALEGHVEGLEVGRSEGIDKDGFFEG